MFFESQPWLDSDCEDDFYSINGGNHRKDTSIYCLGGFHSSARVLYVASSYQCFSCASGLAHAVPFFGCSVINIISVAY